QYIQKCNDLIKKHNEVDLLSYNFEETEDLAHIFDLSKNLLTYRNKLKKAIDSIDALSDFFDWKNFMFSIPSNFASLIKNIIKLKNKNWERTFEYWYFYNLLIKTESEIGPFNKNNYELNEIADVQDSLMDLQPEKIKSIWIQEVKDKIKQFEADKGKFESLYNQKRNNNYNRANSLRKLLHADFELFTAIFPVILINPVAASSVLPLKEGIFDLVIFDEASQLRLEDTYTALIRGKYKVISGDVHQMPPSNYFGNEIILEDEDFDEDGVDMNSLIGINESLELADKESLLEYGIDSSPEMSFLDFHYRSRHPYLIDFSNAAFYGSRLNPMPARNAYRPIRLLQVNGIYEKSRTNPTEAKVVTNILFSHINPNSEGHYPSIGIATFNIDQRNLILEMIQDECLLDEQKSNKYEKLKESGLFVKNLENIQGDERDIIILSTTFGLNTEGQFRQSFGPLNQEKGYKLLNVIITRAKYQAFVCTSIPPEYYNRYNEEIQVNGNKGKAIFYAYLAYAHSIEKENEEARESIIKLLQEKCIEKGRLFETKFVESPFEQEVYEVLSEYIDKERIEIQYKFGGFRIDFVIKSAETGKPIIALECDGAAYHSSEEAYTYDIYRQRIIENEIGLKFYRIWSTSWWNDYLKEINLLLDFINEVDKEEARFDKSTVLIKEDQDLEITVDSEIESSISKDEEVKEPENITISINVKPKRVERKTDKREKGIQTQLIFEKPKEVKQTEKINSNSKVKIRNIHDMKSFVVSFTTNKSKSNFKSKDIKVIPNQSPLAMALMNKTVGDKVKVAGIEIFYEILEVN
ncbi:MAG: hypothetical protein HOF35_05875, partial [Bacteroidetes bacterium]|nr:hypothetical protein [Bacteroidota bacterium]